MEPFFQSRVRQRCEPTKTHPGRCLCCYHVCPSASFELSLLLTSITGWTNCCPPTPGSQSSRRCLQYLLSGTWPMETSSQSVALVICMDHGGCSLRGCLFGEQSRTFSRESVSFSRGGEAGRRGPPREVSQVVNMCCKDCPTSPPLPVG